MKEPRVVRVTGAFVVVTGGVATGVFATKLFVDATAESSGGGAIGATVRLGWL